MSLKVDDNELLSVAQDVRTFGETADDIFSRYIECMVTLGTEGFKSGLASNNIQSFIEKLFVLKGDLSGITDSIASECEKYIGALDEADDFVY